MTRGGNIRDANAATLQRRRELYTCFSGTMLAIGIRYLADRDEAEDLLHDVFVNVLTNFHKFSYKGEGSLRAWMKACDGECRARRD